MQWVPHNATSVAVRQPGLTVQQRLLVYIAFFDAVRARAIPARRAQDGIKRALRYGHSVCLLFLLFRSRQCLDLMLCMGWTW